jgi:diguanylate cyclase (GGDEF)-like protein/PAS domain S-box-containing protein
VLKRPVLDTDREDVSDVVSVDPETVESGFRALLAAHPRAGVCAIDAHGLFVAPPATMDLSGHVVVGGRSALDVVDPSHRVGVISAWDRVREVGAAHVGVRLRGGDDAMLYFLDMRERHGVLIGVFVADGDLSKQAAQDLVEVAPRISVQRKNEVAMITEVDDATTKMLGWKADQLVGHASLDFVHPDDHDRAIESWMDMLSSPGVRLRARLRYRRSDDTWIWLELTNHNLLNDPNEQSVITEALDVSDEMAAHEAVRSREQLIRRVAETVPLGLLHLDRYGDMLYANDRLYEILGLPKVDDTTPPLRNFVPADRANFDRALEKLMTDGLDHDLNVAVSAPRGESDRLCHLRLRALNDPDGTVGGAIVCVEDITERARSQAELEHRATYDPLTGLPNRLMLTDRLEQALARVRRNSRMFAVLFVDLDRFKAVNDTLGHTLGDQLLVEAAGRIQAAVRETDTVARLGGDEFVVLCEGIEGVHHATDLAERIIATVQTAFRFGDDEAHVSASIGIALSADGTETAEAVLANADIAMYRAKEDGRSRYALFDETMQQWITARVALEADLRQALRRNELRLFCQPFIAADTGMIRGFEALVRWERPGFGLVMPDEFIPVAEETGLIVDIGAWVLEQACGHAASWARRWPDKHLGISVNLSSRQLLTGDIIDVVTGALQQSGLDPTELTLELTESTLIDDAVNAQALLHELRDLGCNLALDDFGTGYSSLTYLRAFPIDIVKIDKSFVRAIGTERGDTAIVAAVIALAKNLGLRVVAEGVENHEQLGVLLQLQCPYLQGYLFSRPGPIEDISRLVEGPRMEIAPSGDASP